jgi:predicted amidohydrolase YtcJ
MTADGASLTFVDVEVEGRAEQCVEVVGGVVVYAGPAADRPSTAMGRGRRPEVVNGRGGALLPGLHDHHLHLLATAATARSIDCGPSAVAGLDDLGELLRRAAAAAPPGAWLRGIGYDDSVTGPLDAATLDRLSGPATDRPVRIRHRSGHRWVLNGAAVAAVSAAIGRGDLDRRALGAGTDLPRGIVHGGDRELRVAWPGDAPPSLREVGTALARAGCTGVTDASADTDQVDAALVGRAQSIGDLPQRVRLLGRGVPERPGGRMTRGEVKVVLEEADLPSLDRLAEEIGATGARCAALHCVGRGGLVLAAAAVQRAGGGPHRLEHASVATPGVVELVASLPLTVVTQPAFVEAHGDRYLREVEDEDLPWLYRLEGWLAAGVPLAAGRDAPYGPLDPWAGMRAAVTRRTAAGRALGPTERVSPERALALYSGPLDDPGGPPRRVVAGQPADLCLLTERWAVARQELDAGLVRATFCDGVPVHGG